MDTELVIRARSGDHGAFTEIVASITRRFHGLAYADFRDPALAEDSPCSGDDLAISGLVIDGSLSPVSTPAGEQSKAWLTTPESAREGSPPPVRHMGVDTRGDSATMVDTPIAERGVNGTVTDKSAAFRELADEHLDDSYRLASAILRDPAEAQDVVHDAFLIAWRKWDTLRDRASFRWWFRRILVNTCRDRLRRVTRHPTVALPDEPRVLSGDPTNHVHDHAVLDRAFAVLSADDKVILILRYFLDLPADDIARLLDIRPGTVGSRLHRAQARLREALTESDHAEAIS